MYLRSLYEKMIPILAKTLKIEKQGNFGDIVIALLERLALCQKVERFRIYSFTEFLDMIDPNATAPHPTNSKLVRLLKRTDLLPWSLREEIFNSFTKLLMHTIRKDQIPHYSGI